MNLSELTKFARKFAVMVRIQGPDPNGILMQDHAFSLHDSGITMLSASGMLVPNSLRTPSSLENKIALVATDASTIDSFLTVQYRENPTEVREAHRASVDRVGRRGRRLWKREIDVMVEGGNLGGLDEGACQWIPSELIALVEIPAAASNALQSLTESLASSPEFSQWEIGWSLTSLVSDPQAIMNVPPKQDVSSNDNHTARSTLRIAFIGVPSLNFEDVPDISASPPKKRGDLLLAVGSPLGILSPVHYLNSASAGFVSNCYTSGSSDDSLLISDVHCLPGMEGGPVFSEHSHLIGISGRPLRQKLSGVEIQMVIPWEVIATAQSDLLQTGGQKTQKLVSSKKNTHNSGCKGLSQHPGSVEPFKTGNQNQDLQDLPALELEKVISSVVLLIFLDRGRWGSGVLLNNHGLVLTNAHLLVQSGFQNTNFKGGGDGNTGIYARLDHLSTPIWCSAMIEYVSKGPLDVALLQLKYVPDNLRPIIPDYTFPAPGSMAYAIGHALFPPQSGLSPSVWSGVVSQVVRSQIYVPPIEAGPKQTQQIYSPAMLEITAAVHPGASGGAVVNADGHMIGLISGCDGTIIPRLNVIVACAALEPIFKFSEDMDYQSLLDILDNPNQQVSSIWASKPQLSPEALPPVPHQPRSLSDKDNKEGFLRGKSLRSEKIRHWNAWNSHPKIYDLSSQNCQVCNRPHGLMRNIGLFCCRWCYYTKAWESHFTKYY